jgi:transcriptional regulator with XRE-family HTH domain
MVAEAIVEIRPDNSRQRRVPTRFGMLLKRHRRAAGLTQSGLAERARMSMRGIQDIERGVTQPYRATLERLVEALALEGECRRELEAARASARRPRP